MNLNYRARRGCFVWCENNERQRVAGAHQRASLRRRGVSRRSGVWRCAAVALAACAPARRLAGGARRSARAICVRSVSQLSSVAAYSAFVAQASCWARRCWAHWLIGARSALRSSPRSCSARWLNSQSRCSSSPRHPPHTPHTPHMRGI